MKEMIRKDLKLTTENAIHTLDIFSEPDILFILIDNQNEHHQAIVGINDWDDDQRYIAFLGTDDVSVMSENELFSICNEEEYSFKSCLEEYVLVVLEQGCAISNMEIDFHASMWNFIDDNIYDVEYFQTGLYSYLDFCKETGISFLLLQNHSHYIVGNNILHHFYYLKYKNHSLVLDERIGSQRLVLGTNIQDKVRTYAVMMVDENMQMIDKEYHSNFQGALSDFNNKFYTSNLNNYHEVEKRIKQQIDVFETFLQEQKKDEIS